MMNLTKIRFQERGKTPILLLNVSYALNRNNLNHFMYTSIRYCIPDYFIPNIQIYRFRLTLL